MSCKNSNRISFSKPDVQVPYLSKHPTSRTQTGLTLVEVLITMLIAAIIGSFAVPSFSNLVKKNRVSTQTNDFVSALVLARVEAIKRKVNINVVANETDHWENGWQVMIANGATLRSYSKFKSGTSLSSANGRNTYQFDSNGRINGSDSLTLCLSGTDIKGRSISISNTGRVSTQVVACS